MKDGDEVLLRVPAKSDYIALVRVVLAAAAAIDPDSRSDRVEDLRVAVSEAVTNAVESHRAAGTDSHVEVRCWTKGCLLYTSPSPRDKRQSRMPSSA